MVEDKDVRSWSGAPKDILALILSKLHFRDAATFYMVCKLWSKVERPQITSDEEICSCPCLIFPKKRFFHPLSNTWFQMDTTHELPKGTIFAQNHGWLLMRLLDIDNPFFFHPFTGEQIDVPDDLILDGATFSAPPTSLHCEIVAFSSIFGNKVSVLNIKRGEQHFSIKSLCKRNGFPRIYVHKTIFFQGKFYGLAKNGNLAIYDPEKNKHCVIHSAQHLWEYFYTTDCGRYLFEGDGSLWAVFIALKGKEICICKLNQRKMHWEIVHDLGERMIFLSYESCMMERAKVKGTGNKIYFQKLVEGNCLFYSLATKRYHTFKKGTSYDSFKDSQHMTQCTWIKMNASSFHSQTCSEDFIW